MRSPPGLAKTPLSALGLKPHNPAEILLQQTGGERRGGVRGQVMMLKLGPVHPGLLLPSLLCCLLSIGWKGIQAFIMNALSPHGDHIAGQMLSIWATEGFRGAEQ